MWLDADARPVQCEPAKVVAPTLVAVSDEDLSAAYHAAYDKCQCLPQDQAVDLNCCDRAGIRAVRAKLGAAEVTEERLTRSVAAATPKSDPLDVRDLSRAILANLRATAAKGG